MLGRKGLALLFVLCLFAFALVGCTNRGPAPLTITTATPGGTVRPTSGPQSPIATLTPGVVSPLATPAAVSPLATQAASGVARSTPSAAATAPSGAAPAAVASSAPPGTGIVSGELQRLDGEVLAGITVYPAPVQDHNGFPMASIDAALRPADRD